MFEIVAVDICNFYKITMNLFVASIFNALLPKPVRSGGWSCLGRFGALPQTKFEFGT